MDTPKFDYLFQEYASMKHVTEEYIAGHTRYRVEGHKGFMPMEQVHDVLLATHRKIQESRRIDGEKRLQELEDAFGPDGLHDPVALGLVVR